MTREATCQNVSGNWQEALQVNLFFINKFIFERSIEKLEFKVENKWAQEKMTTSLHNLCVSVQICRRAERFCQILPTCNVLWMADLCEYLAFFLKKLLDTANEFFNKHQPDAAKRMYQWCQL